jgi:hypothetical protein
MPWRAEACGMSKGAWLSYIAYFFNWGEELIFFSNLNYFQYQHTPSKYLSYACREYMQDVHLKFEPNI